MMKTKNGKSTYALLPTVFALIGVFTALTVAKQKPAALPDYSAVPPASLGNADSTTYAKRYPQQFATWKATSQMNENTKYGGSGERDYLAEHPNLVVMWAGYPFSLDYKQARGHFHAMEDVTNTGRRNAKTPATCYSCKSPGVPLAMARDGVAKFYGKKFDDYLQEIKDSIGCSDCHEPKTMKLQISRPGLIEGYKALGKDISKASKEEMRSLVCAQCHVEYHFKGQDKYLKFPWDFGLKAEDFAKYYDTVGFSDWTHAISGAKMVKMQHPDYEVFQQSLHGKRGVACADCHMPKKSGKGTEFTDHQIQSPIYMLDRTCLNCHDWTAEQAKTRIVEIQDRNRELLDRAERVITAAHIEIGDTMKLGATDEELVEVRKMVSQAQMYWDYVAASNGMGFHAPQESARVLGKSVDIAQECRLKTQLIRTKHGSIGVIAMPDISTKQKAQEYIKPFVQAATIKASQTTTGKP